jgi:hypothetical protein
MNSNDKASIRICDKDWVNVTNETTSELTYTMHEIIVTNGEPEKIATNR